MHRSVVGTFLFSPFDPKVNPIIQLADFYPKDDGHIGVYVDVYSFDPIGTIGSHKLLREKLREVLYEKCLRLNMTVLKSFFNAHKIFDGIIVKSVMPGVVFDCVCTTLDSLRNLWSASGSGSLTEAFQDVLVTEDFLRQNQLKSLAVRGQLLEWQYAKCRRELSLDLEASKTLFKAKAIDPNQVETQRYDGWYNNLAHSNWGTVGSRLHRKVMSAYSDGVYQMQMEDRPSAREVSDLVFQGPDGLANLRNVTAIMAHFSQLVAYEIMQSTETSCPLEMLKIPVRRCDKVYDENCQGATAMPFFRAKYDKDTGEGFNNPREQINEKTSWIDASFIYSTQMPWVNTMRSFENGTLREGPMRGYPPLNSERLPLSNPPPPHVHKLMDPERLFLLGDPRVNENPALLSIGLMFYRWHNVQARRLQRENPSWTDQQLFDRARQWVIATLQNIIFYEFLPAFLNTPVDGYTVYNPEEPPGVSHIFAACAFRYPHTLIPPGMFLRNGQCHYRTKVGGFPAVRLCNTWWNAQEIVEQYTVDELILGMVSQIAERDDHVMVSDLRDFVFGPMHFSRRDLGALTIMRGRDNGLPDYNTARKAFHLVERSWETVNVDHYRTNSNFYRNLSLLYDGDISKLDVYVGGILEGNGSGPGDLFSAIIKEQFYRIRNADRFWFENRDNNLFSDAEISAIRATTLHDVITNTTDIVPGFLQRNVFFWSAGDPCPQPFQLNSSHLEPCIKFMRHDHFEGNEISFIFSCIFLAVIPLLCAGIGYLMIRHRKKFFCTKDKSHSVDTLNTTATTNDNNNSDNSINSRQTSELRKTAAGLNKTPTAKKWQMGATEWLHERYSRTVTLSIGMEPILTIIKRRGGVLRTISFEEFHTVPVSISDDRYKESQPYTVFSLSNNHDLVLRFDSKGNCVKFLQHLEEVLRSRGKILKIAKGNTDDLLESAETSERRQRKLELFFREAYATAFNLRSTVINSGDHLPNKQEISRNVLNTRLTKAEFADALGMKEEDLFISRMFSCVARSHPDNISFQEFLDTVELFSKGSMADKLHIVFKMCDPNDDGVVDREEFCTFLGSIVSAVGADLSAGEHHNLVDSMLLSAGVPPNKSLISYKDFEALLSHMNAGNKPIGLHFKGRKQTYLSSRLSERESLNSFSIPPQVPRTYVRQKVAEIASYLEDYRQHITCLLLFFCLTIAFFWERYWHYSQMSEHRDLRRVMGLGIAVTRGAAAALSFSYSILLLTVCRNVITKLRETPLNNYIPFDAAIVFHKIVALVSLVFSAIHTVGHVINFYHIGTQAKDGLDCLFQEAVFSSDTQPSITYWLYGTVTGITGILLVVVLSVMYVFAAPSIINNVYYAFRVTHLLHVLFYVLMIAHGLPKLLDKPRFWCFLLFPAIVFVIDKLMTLKQKYKKLEVLSASILASDVTYVQFKRPRHFHFRSGQWVRISCPAFNCNFNELHSFSIASAPQDPTLEIYVKAQGPWTWKLRQVIQEAQQLNRPYPHLHMDGPYGGGNQDWYNYEVSVMVGGGIGITPYASMLLDLVQAVNSPQFSDVACKKVYFIWVCSTHRNFEWFIDVLRRVEKLDVKGVLEVHIFITQFFHKFDLRTTMLYISEKHFQCLEKRSMFTGLKAVNHFGRPNMTIILKHVQEKHEQLNQIGIFSCGPGTLNRSVREACESANRVRKWPHFVHRYETF